MLGNNPRDYFHRKIIGKNPYLGYEKCIRHHCQHKSNQSRPSKEEAQKEWLCDLASDPTTSFEFQIGSLLVVNRIELGKMRLREGPELKKAPLAGMGVGMWILRFPERVMAVKWLRRAVRNLGNRLKDGPPLDKAGNGHACVRQRGNGKRIQ
jgi:hypothetical protein